MPVRPNHEGVEVELLRALARTEAGLSIPVSQRARLEEWKAYLTEKKWVVHYEPDTDEGFFYVDARPGIDTGFVRVPGA